MYVCLDFLGAERCDNIVERLNGERARNRTLGVVPIGVTCGAVCCGFGDRFTSLCIMQNLIQMTFVTGRRLPALFSISAFQGTI